MDKFRVVITVSHRSISMEYWQEGVSASLRPVNGAKWPAPLAVYCSSDGIVIGTGALQACMSRQPEAYNDIFALIRQGGLRFNFKGEQYEIQKLLLVAVESYLARFLRETLFSRCGTLEDNRAGMPLVLALEGDITEEEKLYLRDLFLSAGYRNLHIMEYDRIAADHFAATTARPRVLVVWSDGHDLAFSLYDRADTSTGTRRLLPGKGRDPRLKVLTDKMWDDIAPNAWLLTRDDLQETLEREAALFLSSGAPEKEGVVSFDGSDYSYFINNQTATTLRVEQTREIRGALAAFLEENGCSDPAYIQLVLRGDAADNDYFASTLSHGFTGVLKADDRVRRMVKDGLAICKLGQPEDAPIFRTPRTEKPKRTTDEEVQTKTVVPEEVPKFEKAELFDIRALLLSIRFKYQNGDRSAAENLLPQLLDLLRGRTLPPGGKEEHLYKEMEELRKSAPQPVKPKPEPPKPPINKPTSAPPPPPQPVPKPQASELSRPETRELKVLLAQLRAKFRMGDPAAALRLWEEVGKFLKGRNIPENLVELYKGAEQDIAEARRPVRQAPSKPKPSKPKSPPLPSPRQTPKTKPAPPKAAPVPPQSTPGGDARELLKAGKFAEAKRQFARQGDSEMAAFCGDLIRGLRNFMTLKFALLDDRNRSNPNYVKNACSQLEAYIALLRKAELSDAEPRRLLQEYKNPK